MTEPSFKSDVIKRILVVDDDKPLSDLLCKYFRNAKLDAKAATRGKEAIDLFKEFRPHLVLLDLLLPDMSGFDVLKRMREPSWADQVTFLVISGIMKDAKSKKKVLDEYKADEFIEKPFDVKELHRSLAKHLGLALPEDKKPKMPPIAKVAAKETQKDSAPVIPEPQVTIEGGDLAQSDIPRILSAFFSTKVTGVLKVNYGDAIKAIFFEEGKPIFAASNDVNDRLGNILVKSGRVTQAQIDAALKAAGDQTRLGTALIQLQVLSPSDLYSLIQLQLREIILSTFTWSSGRYAFHFEDLAARELIKLQTAPADLVLEGIRKHYTLNRLLNLLASKERVLIKSDNAAFRYQELHLGSSETKIFDAINGRRTLDQLVREAKVPELGVLQLLYALLAMKIVVDKT